MINHSCASVLANKGSFTILVMPDDNVAASVPATWAIQELKNAIEKQGSTVTIEKSLAEINDTDFCIYAGGFNDPLSREIFMQEQIEPYREAEALCIVPSRIKGRTILFAGGADNLGLVYALTELADRIDCIKSNREALEFNTPVIERPASRTRSMMRNFSSEVEDKPWFYDKGYWIAYLDMLVYSRINRFSFTTGMGYNLVQRVSDGYFLFPYPFLLDVPGFNVTARGLSVQEREKNLEMLKFIGNETSRRGLQLQFGIWTLAYKWEETDNTTYQIEGLTDQTHADYCRDALLLLLHEVPGITGVTMRVHYESGILGGTHDFWKKQFEAFANCERRVELDMHGKDMAEEDMDAAFATNQPVVVSPKFCGEHMGLPYHQASIRELERAPSDNLKDTGIGLLKGNRRFTRYGYADYLLDNRNWDVLYRIWPGTQRFLLSGDPALFAGYGRTASFCGAMGFDLCEPLHFKGRRGTGVEGGRCGYLDTTLNPHYDFQKYEYFYRLWGRLGYNPNTQPEVWRRAFTKDFGAAAQPVENALTQVSRVLPLFYISHAVSANCTIYSPELYANSFIAKDSNWPYDTREPKTFGNISPMDPQLFQSPDEYGQALLEGESTGKYNPVDVAQWLEDMAETASDNINMANVLLGKNAGNPGFRRIEEDVLILIGLSRFFAAKLRSSLAWRIYSLSGERKAAHKAIELYEKGRNIWALMAERAEKVYRKDISYGPRGHWIDRLPSFDEDIDDLRSRLSNPKSIETRYAPSKVEEALTQAISSPKRPTISANHVPVTSVRKGDPLSIKFDCDQNVVKVILYYRHTNQAEQWQRVEMNRSDNSYFAEIPGEYTAGRFPLQYYFEVHTSSKHATLFPALERDLANVPYFLVKTI